MTEMREPPADKSWLEMEGVVAASRPEDPRRTAEWEMGKGDGNGRVLHMAEVPHACRPPDILTFGPITSAGVPSVTRNYPPGSVWQCECGLAWVVRHEPGRRMGTGYRFGGDSWCRQSRRERRRRLGLKWWRREAR